MKHTKNTHNVHLDTQKNIRYLNTIKDKTLYLVKGEQPAQRWVDDTCFSKSSESYNPVNVEKDENRVISIEDELSKLVIKY